VDQLVDNPCANKPKNTPHKGLRQLVIFRTTYDKAPGITVHYPQYLSLPTDHGAHPHG